jgi:hypothetical protein
MRMVNMVFLLIAFIPLVRPTPITAPTIADDVDTGIPNIEKR